MKNWEKLAAREYRASKMVKKELKCFASEAFDNMWTHY